MKQTQNQYYGLKRDLPSRLGAGSMYFCTDLPEIYLYKDGGVPWIVGGSSQKLTTTQINNLQNKSLGQIVFDTDAVAQKYWNGSNWIQFPEASTATKQLVNRVICTQENKETTLGGVIDSTKEYFIDGVIDMGTTQITVPIGGMTIRGYSFDISGLFSTEDNHTLFISESIAIGSGNLLCADMYFMEMGAGSKLMELYADSSSIGGLALEFSKINFINCTSLGDAYNYRQWLESNTGRFGGAPAITYHGIWGGGAKITDSITRGISATYTGSLFNAGNSFQMQNRFYTELNVDLSPLSSLVNFEPANFPNEGTLQLQNCIVSRDGNFNDTDVNLTPNVSATDACSNWSGNVGLPNTFVDNFVKTIKGVTPPTDTSLLWLEDESDHTSLYAYDDKVNQWVGTEKQYEFVTAHTITVGQDFEVGAAQYRIPITHDSIPIKIQVIMDTPTTGVLGIRGEAAGFIGGFVLDGSSNTLQGSVADQAVILKGDKLFIQLSVSGSVTNSIIILTMKNIG